MDTRRFASGLLRAALVGILWVQGAPAIADVLVLRSSGGAEQRYPIGRYGDDAAFTLASGETLVVLSRGSRSTLRGPGTYEVRRLPQGSPRRVIGSPARLPFQAPPDFRHLDVRRTGRVCLASGRPIVLWRPQNATWPEITISSPDEEPRTFRWPSGAATLTLPSNISWKPGAAYSLMHGGSASPIRLFVRALPDGDLTPEQAARVLVDAGCAGQVDTLIVAAQNRVSETPR
jgi:hypothetical protein